MNKWRVTVFVGVVLTVWSALNLFVFQVLDSVPWVVLHISRGTRIVAETALWSAYPLARILDACQCERAAGALEGVGANWIGILFLLFSAFLVTELFSLGGLLTPDLLPTLLGWAALAALGLSVVALVQGGRDPVFSHYEVRLPRLPQAQDGLVLIAISDLHLGTLLGRRWLARQVARVSAAKPDVIAIVGDLVDGNVARVTPLLPALRELRAPLGVWIVSGNHEYYAGIDRCLNAFAEAGYSVLRDSWTEVAPGLVVAGIDDLTARGQLGISHNALEQALAGRPNGATVLLSHTPWLAKQAAAAGVGLMLSGHTHGGQIWPFNYLVQLRYPFLAGRYILNGMTLLVGRGTGSWGPRMRLWRPAEVLRITLRSPEA